uniref:Uncharacterized protein n=1 Tax=Vitis vinifera TaxID=29760 RepID=A5ALK1_VITVI|nr:hypothetical protein VITISV_035829 [Vitis vinifera]
MLAASAMRADGAEELMAEKLQQAARWPAGAALAGERWRRRRAAAATSELSGGASTTAIGSAAGGAARGGENERRRRKKKKKVFRPWSFRPILVLELGH